VATRVEKRHLAAKAKAIGQLLEVVAAPLEVAVDAGRKVHRVLGQQLEEERARGAVERSGLDPRLGCKASKDSPCFISHLPHHIVLTRFACLANSSPTSVKCFDWVSSGAIKKYRCWVPRGVQHRCGTASTLRCHRTHSCQKHPSNHRECTTRSVGPRFITFPAKLANDLPCMSELNSSFQSCCCALGSSDASNSRDVSARMSRPLPLLQTRKSTRGSSSALDAASHGRAASGSARVMGESVGGCGGAKRAGKDFVRTVKSAGRPGHERSAATKADGSDVCGQRALEAERRWANAGEP
jgi:hypothetical protein